MTTVPKAKRKTDPCPCGSGKQYRYCHGAAVEAEAAPKLARSPGRAFLLVLIVGIPLAWALASIQGEPGDTAKERVWSPEHGHYHTVDGAELPAATADGAPAATPPPGPVPPGKVWSPEHGHWHEVGGAEPPPASVDPANGMPWDHAYELHQPEGEAPEGMTWSAAHGHWHPNGP